MINLILHNIEKRPHVISLVYIFFPFVSVNNLYYLLTVLMVKSQLDLNPFAKLHEQSFLSCCKKFLVSYLRLEPVSIVLFSEFLLSSTIFWEYFHYKELLRETYPDEMSPKTFRFPKISRNQIDNSTFQGSHFPKHI